MHYSSILQFVAISLFFLCFQVAQAQMLQPGDVAPDFTVTDMNGVTHHLYDYLDQGKYVILKFGFIGCGACEATRPGFNNMYYNFGCNEKDIILLEFDVSWAANEVEGAIDWILELSGGPLDAFQPFLDILYITPSAPYITTDGGSLLVDGLYSPDAYSTEFVIEPTSKTILGSSWEEPWETAFGEMHTEGIGFNNFPSVYITSYINSLFPDFFHYVPGVHLNDYLADNGYNMHPLPDIPLHELCDSTFTSCDLVPNITNTEVVVETDTSYAINISWDAPQNCDEYIFRYGPTDFLTPTNANYLEVTTTDNVYTIDNLRPGLYQYSVRCSCNTLYNSGGGFVEVEPQTDFTLGSQNCPSVCNYTLELSQLFYDYWGVMTDSWLRVESNGIVEYFSMPKNIFQEASDGPDSGPEFYEFDLSFCSNNEVEVTMFSPGFPFFGSPSKFGLGFKMTDADGNIIIDRPIPSDLEYYPSDYLGYETFPSFLPNCLLDVSVEEANPLLSSVHVYAMPNQETVEVRFSNPLAQTVNIQLIDINGRILQTEKVAANSPYYNQWSMNDLTAGLYLFRFQTQQNSLVKKVTIW